MADEANIKNLFGSDEEESDGDERMRTADGAGVSKRDDEQRHGHKDGEPAHAAPEQEQEENLEDDMDEDEGPAPGKAAAAATGDGSEEDEPGAGTQDGGRGKPMRPTAPPMEIEAPLLPLPPRSKLHLVRASNIIDIEPRPFDPATFEADESETQYIDEKGNTRVRLNSHKMRWRLRRGPDGREVRESNARFVRWSDGSIQLLVGNEVLDVTQQDISHKNYYLFAVRSILQGQAQLSSRLALRPASLDSVLHRKLREAVDKRHGQGIKMARHGGLMNPEADKAKREAAVEAQIKSREQLQKKQDKVMSKYGGRPSRPTRLSENYLEEDQDFDDGDGYDDEEGGASQRARAALGRRRGLDADEEAEAARRLQSAKRSAPPAAGAGASARKRRRAAAASDEEGEEEEEEELQELPEEGDEEEEEEYKSSGEGSDSEEEEDEEEEEEEEEEEKEKSKSKKDKKKEGGGGAKEGGKRQEAAPPASRGADAAAAAQMKSRRGVVLSDDEDE